jgi:hypothetical protein
VLRRDAADVDARASDGAPLDQRGHASRKRSALATGPAAKPGEESECGVYGFLSRRGDLSLLGRFGEFALKLVELVKLRPAETEAR